MHRLYLDDTGGPPSLVPGMEVLAPDDEAHHAVRVRRLGEGDRVEVLDGAGALASATISAVRSTGRRGAPEVLLRIDEVRHLQPVEPAVTVRTATPKGSRLDDMIDHLSQVGVRRWTPLNAARSVVDPRPTKLDRVRRIAQSASKQCGRAWLLEVGGSVEFGDALPASEAAASLPAAAALAVSVVLADASGEPYAPTGAPAIDLLIGPEGGWTEDELAAARERGVVVARFGPHTMRIETAAVVAASIIMDLEARVRVDQPGTASPVQGLTHN